MSRRIEVPPRDVSAPVRVPAKGSASKKPSGVFHERHTSAQDPLYQAWILDETPLTFMFDDGSALSGILRAFDTYALHIVDGDGVSMIIFKQSLRWVRPT
ncbi:MAG: hypothetical protein OWU33_15825 [Firmicutes bacterium]|jgi:sRNA-binding regulator protein Hfq|nr:hypothetical protein [Bacillota bacterium]